MNHDRTLSICTVGSQLSTSNPSAFILLSLSLSLSVSLSLLSSLFHSASLSLFFSLFPSFYLSLSVRTVCKSSSELVASPWLHNEPVGFSLASGSMCCDNVWAWMSQYCCDGQANLIIPYLPAQFISKNCLGFCCFPSSPQPRDRGSGEVAVP